MGAKALETVASSAPKIVFLAQDIFDVLQKPTPYIGLASTCAHAELKWDVLGVLQQPTVAGLTPTLPQNVQL